MDEENPLCCCGHRLSIHHDDGCKRCGRQCRRFSASALNEASPDAERALATQKDAKPS